MTKIKFLLSLHDRLSGLPQDEVEERLNFYSEMIEDRMEEGISEEEAVAAIGPIDEIAEQIIADIPLAKMQRIPQVSNASVTVVRYEGDAATMVVADFCDHLIEKVYAFYPIHLSPLMFRAIQLAGEIGIENFVYEA